MRLVGHVERRDSEDIGRASSQEVKRRFMDVVIEDSRQLVEQKKMQRTGRDKGRGFAVATPRKAK